MKRYIKVSLEGELGVYYIEPLSDMTVLQAELEEAPLGSKRVVEVVELSLKQYLDLPDFQGF